ncbi:hypothetical protein KM472_gp123 [Cynomolgus macaque cytomegalovirus strain Ottawa]|uniref:Uncharacterized protein n=1 Tax=macacine betaherpesvirus 8 TaxID=2560567 RepID=G8H1C6_9BETA|nr:hypothetical protein KM472_gp123 [Cynomolgus macaque cytomegalovirus strain Ottawa]AEQ32200.1 hypothetical protein cy120 [Cynomolgus macaque cytomegalovirus strain Ottawa]
MCPGAAAVASHGADLSRSGSSRPAAGKVESFEGGPEAHSVVFCRRAAWFETDGSCGAAQPLNMQVADLLSGDTSQTVNMTCSWMISSSCLSMTKSAESREISSSGETWLGRPRRSLLLLLPPVPSSSRFSRIRSSWHLVSSIELSSKASLRT